MPSSIPSPRRGKNSSPPSTNGAHENGTSWRPFFKAIGVATSDGWPEAVAEECLFCGRERHLFINLDTGQYDCKVCGERGNGYRALRQYHSACLEATTGDHYSALHKLRRIPPQTAKRWGLAFDECNDCWLIPAKSAGGEALNLLRYWPDRKDKNKLLLPRMAARLFGLDQLSDDTNRVLFLVEGPLDGLVLDTHLRSAKTRKRYDILAVPGANVFKDGWETSFKGREVRVVFDNDKAGRDGQRRVAEKLKGVGREVSLIAWPEETPSKYDVGDLVRDGQSVVEFTRQHSTKVGAERRLLLVRGDAVVRKPCDWLWPHRLPLGQFVSLEGEHGSGKSTIVRDIAARVTAGLPMPKEAVAAVAAAGVIYFTSEDSDSRVVDLVAQHGGDLSRLHVHDIATSSDEPLDLLDVLGEVEGAIRQHGVKLVIVDALNSFVGGDITSDSKARKTMTGKLQSLASRTGVCLIGVRNFGKDNGAAAGASRALGAVSLSHVARACLHTAKEGLGWQLVWEKVSDADARIWGQPLPYRAVDRSTGPADAHLREILWAKLDVAKEALKVARSFARKKGAENGSEKRKRTPSF